MIDPLHIISGLMAPRAKNLRSNYEKCRPERAFEDWMLRTSALALLASAVAIIGSGLYIILSGTYTDPKMLAIVPASGILAWAATFYARSYTIRSNKDYRGALIDASIVHVIGFMLTMAESNHKVHGDHNIDIV